MKALIKDNMVVDVVEKEFPVHSDFKWMDCPDNCVVGNWHLTDKGLEEKPVPSDTRTYEEKRSSEYPPMTDYLDGIVKNDQDQIDKYIADCKAVKDKYPKG